MQPGSPGPDPYGQQPPYSQPQDPYSQPQDPYSQPPSYGQPQDPYGQPQYGQPPTSGSPYGQPPTSGSPYGQPTSGSPYGQPAYPPAPQYPAGHYAAPGFGPPVPVGQNNTLGLVGMILGILSLPLACCRLFGILFGVAGVVLGYLGKRKADEGLATNRGQAMAGLICGAIGTVLALLWTIVSFAWDPSTFEYNF